MMTEGETMKGICAVCFRAHVLKADKPSRHGFRIVGAGRGHGHLGAWHTGPCFGWRYSHFGLSCEGTKVALMRAKESLVHARSARGGLQAKPTMTWYPRARRGMPSPDPVQVTPGMGYDGMTGRPSYNALLEAGLAENERVIDTLTQAIATYEAAIADWKPAAATEAPARSAPPCHLAANWKGRSGMPAPKCRQFSLHLPGPARYADDAADVTCKACRKAMGAP